MKDWQFNVLFFVGVGSAIFLLVAPKLGFDITSNPTALTGVGAILTYVLTQKKSWTHHDQPPKPPEVDPPDPPKSEVEE